MGHRHQSCHFLFYNLSTSPDIKHLCNEQEAQGQLGL